MTLNHFRTFIVIGLAAVTPLLAQDTPEDETPDWQIRFENLPQSSKEEFGKHMLEGSRLFGQKRIFEALNSVTAAEKIYPDVPNVLNLKGACYVEFRDFKTARKCFLAAAELSPNNADISFNLAEIDFVTEQWQSAEKRLTKVLEITDKKRVQMRRLIEFKMLLVKIKLEKDDEVKALAAKFDFDDDSPFHYYAEAALAYEAGNTEDAERWLRSCQRVFRSQETLAPWQDTLIEFGYIRSFYGGDLEDPTLPTSPAPPSSSSKPSAPAAPEVVTPPAPPSP